jgi:hypothetical protein
MVTSRDGLPHGRRSTFFTGLRGMVTRSVRSPLAEIAVSRPAGMESNQPSFTTRRPRGPVKDSSRGLAPSQSAVPSMTRIMRP